MTADQPTLFDQPPKGTYPKKHSAEMLDHIQALRDARLEHIRERNHAKAAKLQDRISGVFNDRRED